MTRGQVTHRFSKLDNLGWIDITKADQGKGNREPPKVALLTDEGDKAIKSGEAGKKVLEGNKDSEDSVELSKEQVEQFAEEVDSVKNRLNVVVDKIGEGGSGTEQKLVQEEKQENKNAPDIERVEKIEREVARLRETVELLNEAVSEQAGSQATKENKKSLDENNEVINELKDEQEYLREWMDVAERHMVAMRLYMEDNDEDFSKYLEKADKN
jgi:hypothetical protein